MKATSGQAAEYRRLVKQYVPGRPIVRNAVLAFLVGGAICLVGQVVYDLIARTGGLDTRMVTALTSGTMVAAGAILTGAGVYDEIGRIGGMGSAIPITGFANSIVSPALEFKREGFVLGASAKMFTIAGPVIVYGLVTAVVVTLVRLVLQRGF
ncbi:MAG: stage V sporulation protein AC [Firmicutes bacterium]|nr:stage V sporulation protein AC [Bacillota bacterium]